MSQNVHPEIISTPDKYITKKQTNNGGADSPAFSLVPVCQPKYNRTNQ